MSVTTVDESWLIEGRLSGSRHKRWGEEGRGRLSLPSSPLITISIRPLKARPKRVTRASPSQRRRRLHPPPDGPAHPRRLYRTRHVLEHHGGAPARDGRLQIPAGRAARSTFPLASFARPKLGRRFSREGIGRLANRSFNPVRGEPGPSARLLFFCTDQPAPYPPLSQRMVSAGYLGKKSGRGFYSYEATPAPPPPRKPGVEDPTDSPAPYGNAEGDVDVGLRRMGDKE